MSESKKNIFTTRRPGFRLLPFSFAALVLSSISFDNMITRSDLIIMKHTVVEIIVLQVLAITVL